MFLIDLALFMLLEPVLTYDDTYWVQSEYNRNVNHAYDFYRNGDLTCIVDETKRGMCGYNDTDFGA